MCSPGAYCQLYWDESFLGHRSLSVNTFDSGDSAVRLRQNPTPNEAEAGPHLRTQSCWARSPLPVLIYSQFQVKPTESWKLCIYFLGAQPPRQEAPAGLRKDERPGENQGSKRTSKLPQNVPQDRHGKEAVQRPCPDHAPGLTVTSANHHVCGNTQQSLAARRITKIYKILSL